MEMEERKSKAYKEVKKKQHSKCKMDDSGQRLFGNPLQIPWCGSSIDVQPADWKLSSEWKSGHVAVAHPVVAKKDVMPPDTGHHHMTQQVWPCTLFVGTTSHHS